MIIRLDVIDAGYQFFLKSSWYLPVILPMRRLIYLTLFLQRYLISHSDTVFDSSVHLKNNMYSVVSLSKVNSSCRLLFAGENHVESHLFLATRHGWEDTTPYLSLTNVRFSPAGLPSWSNSKMDQTQRILSRSNIAMENRHVQYGKSSMKLSIFPVRYVHFL